MKIFSILSTIVFTLGVAHAADNLAISQAEFQEIKEMMTTDPVVYFQEHQEEFPNIDPELRKLFMNLPRFENALPKMQFPSTNSEQIDIVDCQIRAINFFNKWFKGHGLEDFLCNIAQRMITQGRYERAKDDRDAFDSCFESSKGGEYDKLFDNWRQNRPISSEVSESALDELLDPDAVPDNFMIRLGYLSGGYNLINVIIHETGHAIEFAYILKAYKNGKLPSDRLVFDDNDEKISVFFETLFGIEENYKLPMRLISFYDCVIQQYTEKIQQFNLGKRITELQDDVRRVYNRANSLASRRCYSVRSPNEYEMLNKILEDFEDGFFGRDCSTLCKLYSSEFDELHGYLINIDQGINSLIGKLRDAMQNEEKSYIKSDYEESLEAFEKVQDSIHDILKRNEDLFSFLADFVEQYRKSCLYSYRKICDCFDDQDDDVFDNARYIKSLSAAIPLARQCLSGEKTIEEAMDELLTQEPKLDVDVLLEYYEDIFDEIRQN